MNSTYSAIPEKLKNLPNWIVWKKEDRNGKLTKTPYCAQSGSFAKTNDPSTWTTFDHADKASDCLTGSPYDGVGFVLPNNVVGIDFDGAVDAEGVVDPYVLAILERLGNPYTEFSPSGKGLHSFVECESLPNGDRKKSDGNHCGIEIYHGGEGGRYLTVTGNRFSGSAIPKIEDISIPYLLITQNLNKKFKKLWLGDLSDYDNDHSKADAALLWRLSKLLNRDTAKIETVFSASALGQRSKWTDRPKYRKATIDFVLRCKKEPTEGVPDSEVTSTDTTILVSGRADQIAPTRIKWLWENRIAQKLNLLVGNPGEGKGIISDYIAACVTTGRAWFDGPNHIPPSEVVILAGEDDWNDIIVPRLMAANADRSKIHWVKVSVTKNGKQTEQELQLDRDAAALEEFLVNNPKIRLVIVDPISSYLGSAKMIDEQQVREDVLTPLKDIANRREVAIIAVMHLNKKTELDAIHRIGGAMAFVGVSRMAWMCAPKPTLDGEKTDEKVMVKVKGNIVHGNLKGLSYRAKSRILEIEGKPTSVPYVEWIGEVDETANELAGNSKDNPLGRPAQQLPAAREWLRAYLQTSAKPLKEIEDQGNGLHGFSKRTLQRAKEEIGAKSIKQGNQWFWELPVPDSELCTLNFQDCQVTL